MSVKSNTKNKSRINSQKMFFDEIASEEDEDEGWRRFVVLWFVLKIKFKWMKCNFSNWESFLKATPYTPPLSLSLSLSHTHTHTNSPSVLYVLGTHIILPSLKACSLLLQQSVDSAVDCINAEIRNFIFFPQHATIHCRIRRPLWLVWICHTQSLSLSLTVSV